MRIIVMVAILLPATAALLASCGGTDTPGEITSGSSGVEREIHGFRLEETQAEKRLWVLNSEYAWRIPRENTVHLEHVEVVFFNQAGKENSRLTALKGDVDEKSGLMTARERVKLVSADGDTLTTDELVYDRQHERVTGPGFVRIAKPDRVLTGYGFEAKPDLTDYEVHRDVTITVIDRGGRAETRP